MKKIVLLLFLINFITACDKVNNPYPPTNSNLGDANSCDTAVFPAVTAPLRKVLVEDYTGHKCGNCPKAAEELKYADSVYAGQVIPLAIHVGYFADPCPPPPSTLPCRDYTTTAGDEYNTTFYPSAGGLPQGVINRKVFDASNGTFQYLVNYQSHGWTNFISTFINTPPIAYIQIINDFDNSTKKLCTSVKSNFLSNLNGNYRLVVLLTQDSIVDWQVDYRYNPNMIPSYKHQHMLRDAINGAWGEEIASGTVNNGTSIITKYAYNIPNSYKGIAANPQKMHVVAFIYDATTYEVLQAEDAKVIQ
ncbi:MAG: Omp28-related outer membrane protein [Bacteroidia bacterium]|nr:Omp28-related outer membrane protein [Bacteroidia bacterium]